MTMLAHSLTAADVSTAFGLIRPRIRKTPLLPASVDGRSVLLKLEQLQLSGSFKIRGALNALLSGPTPQHVVTASGGNHGLAVATAAGLLGLPATVVVPTTAPEGKARRIEAAGARLIRSGADYAAAARTATALAEAGGHRYLHAYDDPAVIAGQGTLALEVITQDPEVDTVAVAVGGGGLAAGTALALTADAAGTQDGTRLTVAVEPHGCQALADALAAGRPVDVTVASVAASALGATRVGALPYAVLSSRPVSSVLVSDEEMLAARDRLWEEFRIAAEPAAAAPFAAWLAGRVPGGRPCIVICGANTDWTAR
jgi:threonine dehydratase